eukprot:tig00020911_g15709.t1
MASGRPPPGVATECFDLLEADAWGGALGLHVPADLDARARRPGTEVTVASGESGLPLLPLPLSYPLLRRLPARPPPGPRPPLAASPLPPGVAEVEETGEGYVVRLSGPAGARLESAHEAVFSPPGGAGARVVFAHPVALEGRPAGARCDACGRAAGLSCCSRCKGAWYCGAKCQREDWGRGHKARCKPPGAGAAAPSHVFSFKKVPAADPERLDLSALPEWGDPRGEGLSDLGWHMSGMHGVEGTLRRGARLAAGEHGASTGEAVADLKESLQILFLKFATEGRRHHGLQLPGARNDVVLYIRALLRTPAGVPLLHVGFADSAEQHLSPPQIGALAREATTDPKTGRFGGLHSIAVTEEELALFRRTLAANARLLDPAASAVSVAGVPLRPSFLVPLYERASLREAEAEAERLVQGAAGRDPQIAAFMAQMGLSS